MLARGALVEMLRLTGVGPEPAPIWEGVKEQAARLGSPLHAYVTACEKVAEPSGAKSSV